MTTRLLDKVLGRMKELFTAQRTLHGSDMYVRSPIYVPYRSPCRVNQEECLEVIGKESGGDLPPVRFWPEIIWGELDIWQCVVSIYI